MAGYLVTNGQPRGYPLGIKDESRGRDILTPITRPQFFPLFFILAQRTFDDAFTLNGASSELLGPETFNKDSVYYTHANAYVKSLLKKANQMVVETVKLPGATKAVLRFSIEVIPTDLDVHTRVSDENFGIVGDVAVNALGARTVEDTIYGSKLVLHAGVHVYPVGEQREFGKAKIHQFRPAGQTVDPSDPNSPLVSKLTLNGDTFSAESTIYPWFDVELSSYGRDGNLDGMRIYTPTTRDDNGPQLSDMKLNRSAIYRIMSVNKEDQNASPEPTYLLTGDVAIDVTFKKETFSKLSGNPISADRTLVPAYSKKATPSGAAQIGPWGRVKVYENELDTLLRMLNQGYIVNADGQDFQIEGEAQYDNHPVIGQTREDWAKLSDPANTNLLNFISGKDHNAIPYATFSLEDSVALGGITFENGVAHFARGGADGLYYYSDGRPAKEVNAKLFDDAVRARLRAFGMGDNKYKDALKYPFSCFIDSGFSLETKLEMPRLLRLRPDVHIVAGTYAVYDIEQVLDPAARSIFRDGNVTDTSNVAGLVEDWGIWADGHQSISDEEGYAQALLARFNAIPESDYYSTPVTRGVIRAHSARVIEPGVWDGYLPYTYEYAMQLSDFCGQADGIWRPNYDFTINPNNITKYMEDINHTYRENDSFSKAWGLGITYNQTFDQFRTYTPAVQTVYPYDDSVLNSAKLMMACCYLEYLNLVVHTRLVGRDDLTDDEFIQETKRTAEELADGVFAGKYIVESNPEILEADKEKGFIWRNHYHIYGNVMKTAFIYGVIAKRMSDYTGSAA